MSPSRRTGFSTPKQCSVHHFSFLFSFTRLVHGLSLTTGNVTWRRGSVRSEPRTQLGFQDRGRVGSAHHSKMVQEVGHRGWLVVFRFPQVQDMLRGTGLGGEVVDVPASQGNPRVFRYGRKAIDDRWKSRSCY